MSDQSHEISGESRREFLKKAGKVAWVVPTIQVVNMATAAAGDVNGSVVTTTSSTSTTTTTTSTTTEPPRECDDFCTIKANWTGNGYSWSDDGSLGAQPCVSDNYPGCNGGDLGFTLEDGADERYVKVWAGENCKIVEAAHKAGSQEQGEACFPAMIANDGSYAVFNAGDQDGDKDISNIQMLICCYEDVE